MMLRMILINAPFAILAVLASVELTRWLHRRAGTAQAAIPAGAFRAHLSVPRLVPRDARRTLVAARVARVEHRTVRARGGRAVRKGDCIHA
jgi:hypothetical protein